MKKKIKTLLCLLFPNKRITLKMIHGIYRGIKLNVSIKNQLGLILYPNETSLQNFLKKKLTAGDIAFDIGSNIGYTSILASKLVGEKGRVYSIEPINDNFLILKKNIQLNKCKNIIAIKKAISNEEGEVEFLIPENGEELSMSSMVWNKKSTNVRKQLAKAITIDNDTELGSLSPKTIKIDVEGAEGLAIEGMKKLITRCKPKIYLECSNLGRETTWGIMKSLNYSCFLAKNSEQEIQDYDLYRHNDFVWIPNK